MKWAAAESISATEELGGPKLLTIKRKYDPEGFRLG
jgi:hypothetical protein